MLSSGRHIECLQRLLSAAAVTAPAEAVYALIVSLQGQAGAAAGASTGVSSLLVSVAHAVVSSQRAFATTRGGGGGAEDAAAAAAGATATDTQQQPQAAMPATTPPTDPAASSQGASLSVYANLDLFQAVAVEQQQTPQQQQQQPPQEPLQQQQQPAFLQQMLRGGQQQQRQRERQPPPLQQPPPPNSAATEEAQPKQSPPDVSKKADKPPRLPAHSGRRGLLQGIKKQLQESQQMVQRTRKQQEVMQQVLSLDQRHHQQQQHQQPPAAAEDTAAGAQAASELLQQQQEEAEEVDEQQRQAEQLLLQQQQQEQREQQRLSFRAELQALLAKQQAPRQQELLLQQSAASEPLLTPQQLKKKHKKQQLKEQQQLQQQHQESDSVESQQQLPALEQEPEEAVPAFLRRLRRHWAINRPRPKPARPASSQLPLLLQYLLLQDLWQQDTPPAHHQQQPQQQQQQSEQQEQEENEDLDSSSDVEEDAFFLFSSSSSGSSSSPHSAQYSNWVDVDTSGVLVSDGYDTFLGVWPDVQQWPEPEELSTAAHGVWEQYVADDSQEFSELQQQLQREEWQQQQQRVQWDESETAAAPVAAAEGNADEAGQWGADAAAAAADGGCGGSGGEEEQEVVLDTDAPANVTAAATDAHSPPDAAASVTAWPAALTEVESLAKDVVFLNLDWQQLQASAREQQEELPTVCGVLSYIQDEHDKQRQHMQQRLQEAAAAAAGVAGEWETAADADAAEAPSSSAASISSSPAVPRWSVGTLFDRADAAAAVGDGWDQAAAEQLHDASSWVQDAAAAAAKHQQDEEQELFFVQDAWEAAAAARAALRASDAAAAAAVRTNPPQLQWPPAPMHLLPAIQCGMLQIEQAGSSSSSSNSKEGGRPLTAGVFALDRDIAAAAGGDASTSSSHNGPPPPPQQPFAWMFSSAAADASSIPAASSRNQPYGLQAMLAKLGAVGSGRQEQLQAETAAAWDAQQPHQQQRPAPPSVDSPLLQQDVLQQDAASAGVCVAAAGDEASTAAGWQWDDQWLVHAAAKAQPPPKPREFVLVPPEQVKNPGPFSAAEQAVLARVTAMAAGTSLELLLWSALQQQAVTLPDNRGWLEPRGLARHALSRPRRAATGRHKPQQRKQQALDKRAASRSRSRGVGGPLAWVPPTRSRTLADWFAPVLYGAFAAVRQTGQLAVSAANAVQQHHAAAAAAISSHHSSSSTSSLVVAGSADAVNAAAIAPPLVALQAAPPYKPGWDAVRGGWQGVWLHPPQRLAQTQDSAWQQEQRQLIKLQQLHERQRGGTVLRHVAMPEAGAVAHVLEELRGCKDTAALHECVQEYRHCFSLHPSLPAAALQQAVQFWGPAELLLGPTAAVTAAAAGGRAQHPAQRRLAQVKATVVLNETNSTAGDVFEQLVESFTSPPPQRYDLLPRDATTATTTSSSSSKSSKPAAAAAAAAAAGNDGSSTSTIASKAECVLQLLSLGVSHRGALVPNSVSLLPLLQHLNNPKVLAQLQEPSVSQLCRQLLSDKAGLQHWSDQELSAAFGLLDSSIAHLQPPALIHLLQQLTQQKHLAALPMHMQERPAVLYRTAMKQLRQHAARAADHQRTAQQFALVAPSLLQLAKDACLAASAAIYKATQIGHILPGSNWFTDQDDKQYQRQQQPNVSSSGSSGSSYSIHGKRKPEEVVAFAAKQRQMFLGRVKGWQQQAAQTPLIAAQVARASAAGQLQQLAGVLALLLERSTSSSGPSLKLPAEDVADLLQLLAYSQHFLTYSRPAEAALVAEVLEGDQAGLLSGAECMSRLPAAITQWLAGRGEMPVQQLSSEAALQTLWAASKLQLPLNSLVKCLAASPLLGLEKPQGKKQQQPRKASSADAASPPPSPPPLPVLHTWPITDIRLLFQITGQFRDTIAAAAAARVSAAAAAISSGNTSRQTAAAAGGGGGGDAELVAMLRNPYLQDAFCRDAGFLGFRLAVEENFQPKLLDALQELLVASAAASARASAAAASAPRKGRRHQPLRAFSFGLILFALAKFDSCTPAAQEAIQSLVPRFLPKFQPNALVRTAWALAVLDITDWKVWVAIQQAVHSPVVGSSSRSSSRGGRAGSSSGSGSGAPGVSGSGGGGDGSGDDGEDEDEEDESDADEVAASASRRASHISEVREAGLLVQLHLAQVFVQHRVPDAAPLLPAALAEKARLEYKRISQDVTVSQLQRDVGHVLGELQAAANSPLLSYELEHKSILGSTDIRVALKDGSRQIAIEVDGPFHYAKNQPHMRTKRNGSTVLRDRLLTGGGFNVLAIPYFEWAAIENGPKGRVAWLAKQLQKLAAEPTSKQRVPSRRIMAQVAAAQAEVAATSAGRP